MTQDDVIRLASEAGFEDFDNWSRHYPNETKKWCERMERFAKLVAAHEREMCAKLAQKTVCDTHIPTGIKIYGTAAAKAIRARGQA